MKVKEAMFQVVRNLGNYETVRYAVTVIPEEGEKIDFKPLKKAIDRQHEKMYGTKAEAKKSGNTAKTELAYSNDPRSAFYAVSKAITSGRSNLAEVEKFYNITPYTRKVLEELGEQLNK